MADDKCQTCNGTGQVSNPGHGNCESPYMECPACKGSGKKGGE